jgi:hypothetical protein
MFNWDRIHKWEENYERDITDDVIEYVCEFFEVESIFELEEDQINEIENFRHNDLSEYSVMQVGFSNLMMQLDDPESYDEDYESEDE